MGRFYGIKFPEKMNNEKKSGKTLPFLFKEKCYVINKYEKTGKKRRKCYEKNAVFLWRKII